MAWLVVDDRVVASLEVASTSASRRKGLLGRDGIEGAMLLDPAKSVHTIRMRFAIDVAHLDADNRVLRVKTMKPWRVGHWSLRAKCVIEAEAGSLRRWGIVAGTQVDVKL